MWCGGFSLVEVLVAMCILAAAIVGASGTQTLAIRTRSESALRSEALQLATSLAERMRANPGGRDLYVPLDLTGAAESGACGADACDPADLARADVAAAAAWLLRGFPSGRLVACRDAAPFGRDGPQWECDGEAASPVVLKVGWRRTLSGTSERPLLVLPVDAP
ncbi:MAG: type IV pilus modification protein PilV [Telluria sp.]